MSPCPSWETWAPTAAKRAAAEAAAENDALAAEKTLDEKTVALCSLSTKFGEDHLAIESILSAFHTGEPQLGNLNF
jgi:hypothetical protein